ncbi:MAG: BrxA family protein, partial [Thermodesulfobacteriota bacterium]|nr:BrxA family protein [Thermodesulfobacteriota bacterium]
MNSNKHLYNAQISAGSLLLKESREIAKLLINQADDAAWHRALVVDNVLQKKSPSSARRMARLIRNRLEGMDRAHWQLVLDSDREVALQSLLVAAIKHSQMLEDFLREVVKEHYRTF